MTQSRINLGRYFLNMVSAGEGSPVVVLETGLGVDSDSWKYVQDQISRDTRVIRYDRAGRGNSDPAPFPRSALDMVNDLHQLLIAAQIPSPYILVGQSFGGLLVRLYTGLNPEQVSGLVLVDPSQEGQFEKISAVLPPPQAQDSDGLVRFRQFWGKDYRFPEKNREGIDFPQSFSQVVPYQRLKNVPTIILSSSNLLPELSDRPEEAVKLRNIWIEMNQRLTALNLLAQHRVVAKSGHFIQCDQPAVIVDAVRQVMRMAEVY